MSYLHRRKIRLFNADRSASADFIFTDWNSHIDGVRAFRATFYQWKRLKTLLGSGPYSDPAGRPIRIIL